MKPHLFVIAATSAIALFACLESSRLKTEWFSWRRRSPTPLKTLTEESQADGVQYVSVTRKKPPHGDAENHLSILNSWLMWLFVFGAIDILIWNVASKHIRSICNDFQMSQSEKLLEIENQDILFDLPLYVGLFGTVLGFILISHEYSSSRDAAYISTVVGIIVSAMMRLCILRRTKTFLYKEGRNQTNTATQSGLTQ